MARLGIDFGTTNTVAVMHDRGLFSVVLHQAKTTVGTIVQEVFPSEILVDPASGQWLFGLEADRHSAEVSTSGDCIYISSLKRQLCHYAEGKTLATVPCGNNNRRFTDTQQPSLCLDELLTGFLQALAESIRQSQSLDADEPLEAVITWPANANGAQRHITRTCFRNAGFEVIDALNEPTASAIEYADCITTSPRKGQNQAYAMAVFDLGGGTFDASVVWIDGRDFRVLSSAGIEELGGDDFDHILLEMFLDKLRLSAEEVSPLTRYALLRHTRAQKETISTGAVKSLFLNPGDFALKGRPVSIPVAAYGERIRPLLKPAVATLRSVMKAAATELPKIASISQPVTIYLVGGSSRLPFVSEVVSAAFPDSRVVLTDKPFQSVAMGAAISAMDRITYRDVFARHFGLIRLKDNGRAETFDVIFPAGTPIPRRGEPPLERVIRYAPAHNIGRLHYLECSAVGQDGMPTNGMRPWSDILFPYDPTHSLSAPLSTTDIVSTDRFAHLEVCEAYRCDADGVITVELTNPARNESRCYEIYRN